MRIFCGDGGSKKLYRVNKSAIPNQERKKTQTKQTQTNKTQTENPLLQ